MCPSTRSIHIKSISAISFCSVRWEKGYEKLIALQGVGHSETTINITNASWNNANTLHQTGQLRHSSLFRTCRRIREHRRILPSLQHSTPFIPCDQEENTNEEPSWTEKIKITSLQDERKSCDLRIYLLPLLICSTCVEYCYAFRHSQTSKQQRRPLQAFHRFMTSSSLLSLEIVLMPSINTNTQCKHILKHNLSIWRLQVGGGSSLNAWGRVQDVLMHT